MAEDSTQKSKRPLKVTVVGDGTVGKTCLLASYTAGKFPTEYVPTVFEPYSGEVELDKMTFDLTLWDTAGQEEYNRLRTICYTNSDAFILCYAVNNLISFEHIKRKWLPELERCCPGTPIVLVATKIDKRVGMQLDPVLLSRHDGEKLAKNIGVAAFVECSALSGENLRLVFQEAVRVALIGSRTKCRCVIL